jgi:hypothetical protein
MKKYFSLHNIGWLIVLFESLTCSVLALSVFLVNGTDAIGKDHLALFLLLAITLVSVVLMKSRRSFLNKAVLGLAVLPLVFIGYQTLLTVLSPGMPTQVPFTHQALASVALF